MKIIEVAVKDIIPYENNPRINDEAVEAVKSSIEQCGYIAPIIIDENNVILAGHTRLKALNAIGVEKAECLIATGLTEEQKKKYRILDNKIAEYSEWDEDMLQKEIEGLDFGGLNIFDFKIDGNDEKKTKKKNDKIIICPKCGKVVIGEEHFDGALDNAEDDLVEWGNE